MADDQDDVLLTVRASPGRRWLGIVCMYVLAFTLIYLAFAQPPALGWQIFMLVLGAGALWLGETMRRSTERVIELTRRVLRDSSGAVLIEIDQIDAVDRSVFAFKPSNGFLIRSKQKGAPRAWQPGLWWRVGRQIGVGGVTAAHQTKPMAELLQTLVAERDGLLRTPPSAEQD